MAGLGGGVGLARLARTASWLGARQRDGAGGASGTGRRRAGAFPRVHHGQGQGCREPASRSSDDLARVAAVREAMGPTARVRVDANGAWSVDDALLALGRLAAHDLEYAEQPCATVEELRDLRMALARNGIDVLIAADESIRKAEDPLRVRDPRGCRRRGGQGGAARVACGRRSQSSRPVGCPPWCPRRSTRASASRPGSRSPLPCRRSTTPAGWARSHSSPATSRPRRSCRVGGALPVGRVVVDPDRLEQLAAPPERTAWWRDRVAACASHPLAATR